jgi:hypothetical protein
LVIKWPLSPPQRQPGTAGLCDHLFDGHQRNVAAANKNQFLQTQSEQNDSISRYKNRRTVSSYNVTKYEFPAEVEFLYDFAVRYVLNKRARL